MKKERIYEFDFVRVICMFIVIAYHLFIAVNQWIPLKKPLPIGINDNIGFGELAVPIFFMLSGASLFYTYGKNKINLKEYFKKRFLGIYPLFWITWIIMFLLYFYLYTKNIDTSIPISRFIFTILGVDQYYNALTGLQSYALISEWFLGCIIIIYFVYPVLQYLIKRFPKTMFIISILIYFLIVLYPLENIFSWEGYNPFLRIIEFIFGIYLFKFFDTIKNHKIIFLLSCILFLMMLIFNDVFNARITIDILNISLFIILIHLWRYFNYNCIQKVVLSISKHSYAVFLNHHVIINMVILIYIREGAPLNNGKSSLANVIAIICVIGILITLASKYFVLLEHRLRKILLNNGRSHKTL